MKNFRAKILMFLAISSSIALLTGLSIWLLSPISSSIYLSNSNLTATSELISQIKSIPEIDPNIPKHLYPCLPQQGIQKLELKAKVTTTKTKKIDYYIVGVNNQTQSLSEDKAPLPNYQQTLVAIDEIGCQVIIPKEKYGTATLTMYIPKSSAYDLSLEYRSQAIAKAGGKDKYQKIMEETQLNSTPGEFSIYFPEDVWALKKLGIKLSASIKIINHINEVQNK